MKKIVVVGSLNIDFVVSTPVLPKEGQTVLGHSFRKLQGKLDYSRYQYRE